MRYTCPCCGYFAFSKPPGSHEVCPICFWEDDLSQLRFPKTLGANKVSLIEAQRNYASFGAIEHSLIGFVRAITVSDIKDLLWHRINPVRDKIEEATKVAGQKVYYSEDSTEFYYWVDVSTRELFKQW